MLFGVRGDVIQGFTYMWFTRTLVDLPDLLDTSHRFKVTMTMTPSMHTNRGRRGPATLLLLVLVAVAITSSHAFQPQNPSIGSTTRHQHNDVLQQNSKHMVPPRTPLPPLHMASTENENDNNDDNKFGFGQRIESIKCLAVGGLVGGLALAPFAALHDIVLLHALAPAIQTSGLAQWEFDNDMGSAVAALFAIVYRYCIRQDTNPQLNQGVIGAFVLTRTLSRIVVSPYCSAIALNCK